MRTILEIDPAYEAVLRAAGLDDFDAVLRIEGGPPTSKHKHRETLPIDLETDDGPRTFFLKRVFKVPPKHAFWPIFRLQQTYSQPIVEWHNCKALEKAGIPAMKAVACGQRQRLGMPTQAFLLVEAVPMAYTLENWLVPGFPKPPPIEKRLRGRLIYELGRLVRKLHDAGLDWSDISAKHIYAAPRSEPDAKRKWSFCLIDVERMTRGEQNQAVSPIASLKDRPRLRKHLRKLLASLSPMQFDRWDVCRLLTGACLTDGTRRLRRGAASRAVPGDRLATNDTGKLLSEFTSAGHLRLHDDYEHPRCVPLTKLGGMFVDERMVPWLQAAGLNGFKDMFRYGAGEDMDKPGLAPHRDRIRMEVANNHGETKVFYLKRYRHPPLSEQLRRIRECGLKSSSGWREMHYIKKLSLLGIPTMRGVAFGQRMNRLMEKRSFGITEEIKGRSLETLANQAMRDPHAVPSWSERKEMIRLLALMTRRLHQNGLYHRDLYLCHVFLTRNADGGIVLRLIDLARMIASPWNPGRWKIKDLAALDYSAPSPLVTRADRLRFLYYYHALDDPIVGGRLRQEPRQRQHLREIISQVQTRARRMARHDAHRSRRLQ